GCEAEFVAHVERCVEAEKLHGITAAILVQPLLYRGSQDAVAMARAACKDMSLSDPFLAGPIANAGLTLALTQAGDLDRARMSLAEIDPTPTGDHRLDGFTGRAAAAVLALEGKRDEAAETAGEVGRRCIAGTYVQLGMLALYDAVR